MLEIISVLAGMIVVFRLYNTHSLSSDANHLLSLLFLSISLVSLIYFSERVGLYGEPSLRIAQCLKMTFCILGYLYIRNGVNGAAIGKIDVLHLAPIAVVSLSWAQTAFFQTLSRRLPPGYPVKPVYALSESFYNGITLLAIAFYAVLQLRILWKFFRQDRHNESAQSSAWREWIIIFTVLEVILLVPHFIAFFSGAGSVTVLVSRLAAAALGVYSLVTVIKRPELYELGGSMSGT